MRHAIVASLDNGRCGVIAGVESFLQGSGEILDGLITAGFEVGRKSSNILHKDDTRLEDFHELEIVFEQLVTRIVRVTPASMGEPLTRRSPRKQVHVSSQV